MTGEAVSPIGQILRLVDRKGVDGPDIVHAVESTLAIFTAINSGELLAALPECEFAQTQHKTALTLLALAERELRTLADGLAAR